MKYAILFKNEMRNIFRDKMLGFLFLFPFIMIGLLFGLKSLIEGNPNSLYLLPLIPILGFMLNPLISGMVLAFIFLDEKDDDIWNALRVMPINKNKYLLLRFIFPFLLAFICVFPIPWVVGIIEVPILENVALSIMGGLQALIIALLICIKAKNKVEGFAFVKILGFLLMLPAASLMIDGNWEYLFSIIPTYWTYKTLIGIVFSESWVAAVLIGGLALHILALYLLMNNFISNFRQK
jgi:fluoroquinolone transport system permease protein